MTSFETELHCEFRNHMLKFCPYTVSQSDFVKDNKCIFLDEIVYFFTHYIKKVGH